MSVEIIKTNDALKKRLDEIRLQQKSIGFIPTLGALHDGHASLIRKAKYNRDFTVCSIFVNPSQFNDPKDLQKYPRTLEKDLKILEELNCKVLYLPDVDQIYPKGLDIEVDVDFGTLFDVMEGVFRPGHFKGVVEVVHRLLDIVKPDSLYMGQKDFQQSSIIAHMIKSLKLPVQLVVCKTKREEHGLAMSSRNERLPSDVREKAAIIYKTLRLIKRYRKTKTIDELIEYGKKKMDIPGFSPEYISIIDGETLLPVSALNDHDFVVVCAAVWAGNIRLIDNLSLKDQRKKN